MPKVNKALAVLAALAFFLPFITISCNGKALVEMSGVKLAKCSISTCSPNDVLSPDLKAIAGRNIPDMNIPTPGGKESISDRDGANFVLFAAIACLVAALTLFVPGRGGELLSGVASVAGIVLLFMFRSKFGDTITPHLHSPEMGAAANLIKIELQFSSGFWLSMILSAASAILAFKGTSGAPAPVTGGNRSSVGGLTPRSSAGSSSSQQMSACPACGTNNTAGNRFCLSCGGSLAAPAPPDKGKSCPRCGVAIVSGSKFCLSCGKPLAVPATAVQPVEAPPVQPIEVLATPPVEITPPAPEPAARAAAAVAAPVAQPLPATASSIAAQPPMAATVAPPSSSAEPPKSQKPVCAACGAEIAPSQKFCLACGTAVGQTVKAAELPESPAETSLFTPAPASSPGQYQDGPFQAPPGSSSKLWIIVVVLLAVLGAAGWYVWKYFGRPDVTITTFQKKIHVATGGRTSLQASVTGSSDTDVDWSIQEGDKGGQIVSLGSVTEQNQSHASAAYTAPQTGGTFHVIAASHANPSRTAKVEIVVGSTSQPDVVADPTPAPPASVTTNAASSQILGTWRGPSSDMKTTIAADSTIVVTSEADPGKNLNGTYSFTDASHLHVDFGNGDVRTWQILGVDSNYMRVLSQSKTESSPTAIVFAKVGG